MVNRVTSKVTNGSIVLFHNGAKNTPAALPKILEKLSADGYTIVPISELIMTDNFTIDHTGKQLLPKRNDFVCCGIEEDFLPESTAGVFYYCNMCKKVSIKTHQNIVISAFYIIIIVLILQTPIGYYDEK